MTFQGKIYKVCCTALPSKMRFLEEQVFIVYYVNKIIVDDFQNVTYK